MRVRLVMPAFIAMLLLLGPLGLAIPSGNPVESWEQNRGQDGPSDELTTAQQQTLDEISPTIDVGGRTSGLNADVQLGWEWSTNCESSAECDGYGIAVDSAGNAYVTGYFTEIVFNSYNTWDVVVAKLDSSGNWLWAKRAGGTTADTGSGIAVDSTGDVYITGYFTGSADFGPSITLDSTEGSSSNVFVAKLDSNGNWLWAKRAGGHASSVGYEIAVDSAGDAYVTGYFTETADFGPSITLDSTEGGWAVFVAKLDSSGNWLWARTGALGGGEGITVDSSGNVYITGSFTGTADFGPNITFDSTEGGSADVFVAKLDSNGNWLWAKSAGGLGTALSKGIAVDSTGDVYITGYFTGTADFGPSITLDSTELDSNNNGNADVFVAKLDSNGNWLWAKRAGGHGNAMGNGIAVDSGGDAYVTGSFTGTADFGPSITLVSTELVSNINGNTDVFVAKLDSSGSGSWSWVVKAGGISGGNGRGIAIDSSGNAYAIGTYYGGSLFLGSTTFNYSQEGGMYVTKMSPDSDNDGVADVSDDCPLDGYGGYIDTDGDTTCDGTDDDDDDDGVPDASDDCATGNLGWTSGPTTDHDSDGCQDSEEDMDDDNDGIADELDSCPSGQMYWTSDDVNDYDGDGCMDSVEDNDDDNDGFSDTFEHKEGTNPLNKFSQPDTSISITIGAVEFSLWDMLGIIIGLLSAGFLAFAFTTRGARYERFSETIAQATEVTIPSLEKRLEVSSFIRLLSPRQSIKLESLLDERKNTLNASKDVPSISHDVTHDNQENSAPPYSLEGHLNDDGWEICEFPADSGNWWWKDQENSTWLEWK